MLMAASTAHAQLKVFRMEKDSIPLFRGFQVSFDLVGAARLMFGDRGEIGGGLRVNLHDQWFPVVEFGIGKANHNADEPTYIAYKTTAPYFRVGIDINLLKNKHQSNRLYGGIRYAFTSYKVDITRMNMEDPIWGTKSDIVVEGMKCSMHWFEVVFGIDTKIFGPLHLGWDVRYKRRLSHKEGDIGQSWYVPGFGVNDQNNIGLSFNAIIDIPMEESRKKRLIWQLPFLALLIVGTVLIIRQQRNLPYHTDRGQIFGTFYTIVYQADRDYHDDIRAALLQVDSALSMFNQQSVISRINQSDGGATNQMFLDVYKKAIQVSQETDGAFDITVAPLVNAWGFGFKNGAMPTPQQVDSIRQFVGWKKVSLKGTTIHKTDRRVMLDCSAIAKGYGVDVAAKVLSDKGITNYMVEIGGEIITHGISPKRLPWKVGTIAISIIKEASAMPTPSTPRRAIPFSIVSCLPPCWPATVPQPMPMPPRLW